MFEEKNLSQPNFDKITPAGPKDQYPRPENYDRTMSRLYLIATIFMIFTIIDSLFQFGDYGAWQILADAGGILIGLIILRVSHWFYQQKRNKLSEGLIPLVIFVAYAPGDLFLLGVTLYNVLSGVLIFALLWTIIRPKNRLYWLISTILFVGVVMVFSQISGLSRFDISQSPSWQISLPVFTLVITLILVIQSIQNLQHTPIRVRRSIVLLSLGLIPTVIAITASSVMVYQQKRQNEIESLETITFFKEGEISNWKEKEENHLFDIAKQEGIIDNFLLITLPTTEPTTREIAYNSLRQNLNLSLYGPTSIKSLSLLDINGNIRVSTDNSLEGENQSDQQYYIEGQKNAFFQPPIYDEVIGEYVVCISHPIYNQFGTTIGVAVSKIDLNSLNEILNDPTNLGETGEAYLVSEDHTLLTDIRNSKQHIPGLSSIESTGVASVLESRGSDAGLFTNYLGEQVVGVYQWQPDLNAALIVEKHQSETFEDFRTFMLTNIAIVTTVIIVAIGISFRITRNILDPLYLLAEKAKLFADGKINTIDTFQRKDEIGELSNAIHLMTNQVNLSRAHMEDIIADRTQALEQRALHLEAAADIGRAATGIHDLENLLTTVTHLISDRFGFYHVGIFLIDESEEYAVLKAANSDGGWRMLARNHKLKIGEQGIVGYVTGRKKPRKQQSVVGDDSVYFDNPDLPMTKSEMALPLIIGGNLIGALDVQSTVEEAFSEEDIAVLQVLADEVAIAIENARLFEQLQQSLEVERRLYGELTEEAWTSIRQQTIQNLNIKSDEGGVSVIDGEILPESRQAILEGITVRSELSDDGQKYPISVPVKVHGDIVVAVLETYKPFHAGPWLSQEIKILESIGEQLGIALENARLFEETQRLAQRERISTDVASKIWSSTNVDTILQTAIQELGRALNVSQGAIRLKFSDTDDSDGEQPEDFGE
jgi:GAF domain-containing protein/HAMP domain-containing protein